MNIEAFVATFKAELRKHGDMFAVEAVDTAIASALQAGLGVVKMIPLTITTTSSDAPRADAPLSALDTLEDTGEVDAE